MSTFDFTLKATDLSGAFDLSEQSVELLDADPLFDKVVSLIHADEKHGSANIVDEMGVYWSRQGGAIVSDAKSRFGNAIHLNGSGSSFAANLTGPGAGDFTLEAFILPDAVCHGGIFGFSTASSYNDRLQVRLYNSGEGFAFQSMCQPTSGSNIFVTTPIQILSAEEFTHVEFSRASGVAKIFINGVEKASFALTGTFNGTPARIGHVYTGGVNAYYSGYIDECRYTKGAVRHVADFTPPSGPFPNA